MRHLKTVELPDLAKRYCELRRAVVESQLNCMMSTPPHSTQQQPSYTGSVDFSGTEWDPMLPHGSYTFAAGCDESHLPYNGHFQ
jgi:hypothetical protein